MSLAVIAWALLVSSGSIGEGCAVTSISSLYSRTGCSFTSIGDCCPAAITITMARGWPFWSMTVTCSCPVETDAPCHGAAAAICWKQRMAEQSNKAATARCLIFQDIAATTAGLRDGALFPSRAGTKAALIVCELLPNHQTGLGHGPKCIHASFRQFRSIFIARC